MADYLYELSWKAAFKVYGGKQFFKDSIVPCTLSILFVVLSCFQVRYSFQELIEKLSNTIISIMPDFISILIAAFAIWISFFLSHSIDYIKKSEEGIQLLNELNASFLIEIGFAIIGMLVTLSVLQCSWFDFRIGENLAGIVNIIVLFIILFICFAVVWWLIYIAKNLHNIAKFTLLYENINKERADK